MSPRDERALEPFGQGSRSSRGVGEHAPVSLPLLPGNDMSAATEPGHAPGIPPV